MRQLRSSRATELIGPITPDEGRPRTRKFRVRLESTTSPHFSLSTILPSQSRSSSRSEAELRPLNSSRRQHRVTMWGLLEIRKEGLTQPTMLFPKPVVHCHVMWLEWCLLRTVTYGAFHFKCHHPKTVMRLHLRQMGISSRREFIQSLKPLGRVDVSALEIRALSPLLGKKAAKPPSRTPCAVD